MKAGVCPRAAPLWEGVAAASPLAPAGPVRVERISRYHPGSWGLERRRADGRYTSPMELARGQAVDGSPLHGGWLLRLHLRSTDKRGTCATSASRGKLGCLCAVDASGCATKSDRPCPQGLSTSPQASLRLHCACKQTSHVGDAGRRTVQTNRTVWHGGIFPQNVYSSCFLL